MSAMVGLTFAPNPSANFASVEVEAGHVEIPDLGDRRADRLTTTRGPCFLQFHFPAPHTPFRFLLPTLKEDVHETDLHHRVFGSRTI